jgi:hypothetical protein
MNRRRTDNAMAKRTRTNGQGQTDKAKRTRPKGQTDKDKRTRPNGQAITYKTLHKLNVRKPEVTSGILEG